jgi:hypothetical protein
MGIYPMMLYGAGIFINIINLYPKNNQFLQVNIPYMEHLA